MTETVAETMIAARGLTKRFGKVVALDRVDLNVPRGAVFGLLGPAGAGKSTLIRLLAGLARSTSGTLTIDGAPAGSVKSRRHLGVLLQDGNLYDWMTAREVLAFAADVAGVPNDTMPAKIAALAGTFQLQEVLDRRVAGLDGPTRGHLSIAQALVADPDLVLLDEPGQALDPDGRRHLLGLLLALPGRPTVVVASRRFADLNALCDRVAVIEGGRVTVEAPIADIRRRMPSVYVIQTGSAGGLALNGVLARLRAEPWVTDVSVSPGTIRVAVSDDDRAARELLPAVVSTGIQVSAFRHEPVAVEQLALAGRRE